VNALADSAPWRVPEGKVEVMEEEIMSIVDKIRSMNDNPDLKDALFLTEVAARIGRIRQLVTI
jgi:hypothetical protein